MTDSAEPAATDHSGDANKMVDPFREAARQAAREAVARSEDEQGLIAEWTLATREGRHDDTWPVRYALTGADAALAAVLPMVVAKCVGVAQERVRINRRAALTCINGSREKMRLLDEANGAESIERAILALATTSEGETT